MMDECGWIGWIVDDYSDLLVGRSVWFLVIVFCVDGCVVACPFAIA